MTDQETIKELRENLAKLDEAHSSVCRQLHCVQAKLARSEAACAEMRSALEYAGCHEHQDKAGSYPGTYCAQSCEICNRIDHALSTSCGTGFVPVGELEPTLTWLREIYEWCVSDCPSDIDGDEAKRQVARLESLVKGTNDLR